MRSSYRLILMKLSGLLYIISAIVFFMFMQENSWRAKERERLISLLSVTYPDAKTYLWNMDSSWVPYSWQSRNFTRSELIQNILSVAEKKLERFDVAANEYPDYSKKAFTDYLRNWGAGLKLCEHIESLEPGIGGTRCEYILTKPMNAQYRLAFFNHYAERFYINDSGLIPVLSEKFGIRKNLICNLTPIRATIRYAAHIAKPSTVKFYGKYLNKKIGEAILPSSIVLSPGDCKESLVSRYDIDGGIWYSSNFIDAHEKQAWFENVWGRYHFQKLRDVSWKQRQAADYLEYIQSSGLEACDIKENKQWYSLPELLCPQNPSARLFAPGFLTDQNRSIFVVAYPGLIEPQNILNNDNKINFSALKKAQKLVKRYVELIETQMTLEKKWTGHEPRFFLTHDDNQFLFDENGPLNLGVTATRIPSKTILGEEWDVPSNVNFVYLVSHNIPEQFSQEIKVSFTREISSKYDVFESLEQHGGNRSGGIDAPISIAHYRPCFSEPEFHMTRFRFNRRAQQEFNTSTDFLSAAGIGISYSLKSSIDGIFSKKKYDWLTQQRYAYVRQFNPLAFTVGDFGGLIFPWGGSSFRALRIFGRSSRAFRINKFAMRAASGTIEAALMARYEWNTAPQFQDFETTQKLALQSAKFGFVFGALLPPGK